MRQVHSGTEHSAKEEANKVHMEPNLAEGMAPVYPRKVRRLHRKGALELSLGKKECRLQRQRKSDR